MGILKFLDDYDAGKLVPYMRSEPVPEQFGPVFQLVGTTFQQHAIADKSRDVLVNFFAPWCGHCRKFEPQYKQLATKLRHVKTLRVAKIDATRNEVKDMRIQGFPTVMLFPAKAKQRPMEYHGDRSPDAITHWLHSHCSHPFVDKDPTPPKASDEDDG